MLSDKQEKNIVLLIKKLFKYEDVVIEVANDDVDSFYMIYTLSKKHYKYLKKWQDIEECDEIYIGEYDNNYTLDAGYWLILNKLARHKKWEPMTILNKVKEFGLVCFNQFESSSHPIDWLYNEYLNLNNN